MRRRQLIQGMAGLFLAEQISGLHAAWANGQGIRSPGLHQISGEVKVNDQPARAGMLIKPGDRVTTGPNSQAIYVVDQDAFLQRSDSGVELLSETSKRGLRILSGKLMSVFGKGEKRIETPTALIGIRGTGCYIEAKPDQVYFCLCYGEASIAPVNQPQKQEIIQTRHHDQPMYLNANARQMMVPADVHNHTDAELILLESLVGRIPPFVGNTDYTY